MAKTSNPFDVTKAVDFNDAQINAFFVDMPNAGFQALAAPRSPMPMLIMGGKGSGKTHLMRYFSYQLQKLRHEDAIAAITKEKFIGLYLRCGGLNANRFKGKGQEQEAWDVLFAYYLELWLGQLVLGIVHDLVSGSATREVQAHAAAECMTTLDRSEEQSASAQTLADVSKYLHSLQRQLDLAVNNCALTRRLDVEILATSGRLVFGIPQILSKHFSDLSTIQFLYLIDEYENFNERQQRYFNTLLREKEIPCSFKIGGRTYGFKTWKTFSDEEEIREGSEYVILPLDERFRSGAAGNYELFTKRLCLNRLRIAGFDVPSDEKEAALFLDSAFETMGSTPTCTHETEFIKEKYKDRERPYFVKLRHKLEEGLRGGFCPGVRDDRDINLVISTLQCPDRPLLEKLNIFLLFQGWRSSTSLISLASDIEQQVREYLGGTSQGDYAKQLEKRRSDLLAQLLRECDRKQNYAGIKLFIKMSEGIPRNLLVILKSVVNWAAFQGEDPFVTGKISLESQLHGVRDAAEWFFDDARQPGDDEACVRDSMRRLATLFRDIRFSDKPSEKALSTFSLNLSACSQESRRVILAAERWSMLLRLPRGQKNKNNRSIDEKFYINSTLAPKWDLPVQRGGAVGLSSIEVDSIFQAGNSEGFAATQVARIAPMTAPYFGARPVKDLIEQLRLGEMDA